MRHQAPGLTCPTLVCWIGVSIASITHGQVLIDHTCTDLGRVSQSSLDRATAELHIAYNHTSHGSHIITGMNALSDFPDFGDKYRWSMSGSNGIHFIDHGIPCSVADLSQGDFIDSNGVTPWVTCTREFLRDQANSGINVVMWSWCSIDAHDAQRYVDNMAILIEEFPEVKFVFMTGHAEGQGEYTAPGSVHFNNQLIRDHCRNHGRILFDFADIEAYDPDGIYYWDRNLRDNLDYEGGNWAREWIQANPESDLARLTTGEGVTGYAGCGSCAHSGSPLEAELNCILKGRAAWWLFAELAGGILYSLPPPRRPLGRNVPGPQP